ncbi:MAG TPA: M14 family zinc carboxypeptidase [Candidatus Limnocylindria bacterium]|nr:M14 family zinc carboxypeptidase [Candidatus Limnocylindria bacterium]
MSAPLRPRVAATVLAAIVVASMPGSAAAANDFPPDHEGYHTYAETSAFLDGVEAAHPAIARKLSIGQSYEGRPIWALKISDNVGSDEDEPEVLFTSQMHAREWLSQEQNLRIADLLTSNYDQAPDSQLEGRVTDIVDKLEIWIIPMLNPDGAEYDISNPSNGFRNQRKNRQPVANGAQPGIDLNRNFGFGWACCGGSSGKPGSFYYRGREPWQGVETARLRDFVLGRIVDGRQQIRAAIDWHAFNEEIMWPFAYTTTDLPRPMAADDLAAFKAVARGMADLNGYMPKQLSDLYVFDGGSSDWLYGDQRIFSLTIEVYPLDDSHVGGFYPPDSIIDRETTRNDGAVLYFLEHVACPYRAADLDDTHCGPLEDDFETARGWAVDPSGTDGAASGAWQRAIPAKNRTDAGLKQRAYGFSARYALVTGATRGASANANYLDGLTSVRSPGFDLGAPTSSGWRVQFRYTFAHGANASSADYVRLLVGGDEVWRANASPGERNAAWQLVTVSLDGYAGQSVRALFEACDCASDSLIEAAVDDVRVYQVP